MKNLVLLGSGPGHLQFLSDLAQAPMPGAEVTLIAPAAREVMSRMLPGWVAGRYALEDCVVLLAPLAGSAKLRLIESNVTALDAPKRRVLLADGQSLAYDALGIDVEPVVDRDAIPGAREHALFVNPSEQFIRLWGGVLTLAEARALSVVVVGGNTMAVELALSVQQRLDVRVRVALVTGAAGLLPELPPALRLRARSVLKRQQVTLFEDACAAITASHVQLGQGPRLACDAPLLVLEGAAPRWLADSPLTRDEQGGVAQRATRQSLSHAEVFFAGGDLLPQNLRRYLAGGELVADRARRESVHWLSCGSSSALAAWGGWCIEGHWLARLKERRERESVKRFLRASEVHGPEGDHHR